VPSSGVKDATGTNKNTSTTKNTERQHRGQGHRDHTSHS
ncbi:hypothetical protein F441_03711, partial [Phytophthora nicotianae CJ01A1]